MLNEWSKFAGLARIATADTGVVQIYFSGVITNEFLRGFMAALPALVAGHYLAAYLADFSKALVTTSVEQLNALLDGVPPDSPKSVAAALIVSEATVDVFLAHARAMARKGIMRLVFTDPDAANEWAQSRARPVIPTAPARRRGRGRRSTSGSASLLSAPSAS